LANMACLTVIPDWIKTAKSPEKRTTHSN
jgi:hypothetical protein